MAIKEFEFFHGVVLTKLVRSGCPVKLIMIEKDAKDPWAVYLLNDVLDLFIKHSTARRPISRGEKGACWTFVFGTDQLRQMGTSDEKRGVCVALVCASPDVKDKDRCVCLLLPDEVKQVVDFSLAKPQSLTIRLVPGKKLRVFKDWREMFKVARERLDKWEVPGS